MNICEAKRHAAVARPAGLLLAVGLAALLGGCLGDERCGPDQHREGTRCVATVDAQLPDAAAPDQGTSDSTPQGDGSAACAFVPTSAELVGSFAQTGTVATSTCVAPYPVAGDASSPEVVFALSGSKITVTTTTPLLTYSGEATIDADGMVRTESKGNFMGITFAISAALCFSDKDNATAKTNKVVLTGASGPICTFDAPGTLKRK